MAVTVKTTKPTTSPRCTCTDDVNLRKIIKMIRTKLQPAARVLLMISLIQITSGMYGINHVYNYGDGASYHRFLYCKAESTHLGPYFEYNFQVILGFILLGGILLKRPYWVVRCWFYLNLVMMSFSLVTFICAYQTGQATFELVWCAMFWYGVHIAEIGFTLYYCHWALQEIMAIRFLRMIKRGIPFQMPTPVKKEKPQPSIQETV